MINGKIHYKWSFSIAMLNYQRVYNQIVIGGISFQVMASMGSPVKKLCWMPWHHSSAGSLSTPNSYRIWSASEKATTCNLDGLMMVNNG